VLAAVEEVATAEGYDYVFDKSGDFLFMFARDQYDVSDAVLREMGVTLDRENRDEQASRSGNSQPDS
jgi:outer membrane protein